MLDTLFDEERIMRAYNKELRDEIIQEGMREGMREGMQKGMREGILYVAKNLLALGLSPAEIAESTKLSLAEINALA